MQQLDDDRAAERDAAEKQLLDLAGENAASADGFLALLPKESEEMPLACANAWQKFATRLRNAWRSPPPPAQRLRSRPTACRSPTFSRRLRSKPGTSSLDNREDQGNQPNPKGPKLTFEYKDQPFWRRLICCSTRRSWGFTATAARMRFPSLRQRPQWRGAIRKSRIQRAISRRSDRGASPAQSAPARPDVAQAAVGGGVGAAAAADRCFAAGQDRSRPRPTRAAN